MSEFFAPVNNNALTEVADDNTALTAIENAETARAVATAQASLILAKRFPRNEQRAIERIKSSCGRLSLANAALYSYVRGGQEVSGPTIRLLEAVKLHWGNIDSGWRELERNAERAVVYAFAWDKETNTREERTFEVPLIRFTKQGSKKLSDPRDIYEAVASQAARRVRQCLQAIIPCDVIEDAVFTCLATQQANVDMSPETIKSLISAFEKLGVTREMIEKRLQRNLDSLEAGHVVQLRNIYRTIIDGIGTKETFFPTENQLNAEKKEEIKENVKKSKKQDKATEYDLIKAQIDDYLHGSGTDKGGLEQMINNSSITDSEKETLFNLLNTEL